MAEITPLPEAEARTFERPPGKVEYDARTAIRDLIELYGPMRAPWLISHFLEDELKRAQQ